MLVQWRVGLQVAVQFLLLVACAFPVVWAATSPSPSGVTVDTKPDTFSFTAQTNVALSAVLESNAVTVKGITAPSPISVAGGEYSINGGAYTRTAGTVSNGATVKVHHTASASFSTAVTTTLTIGGVGGSFKSTTAAKDTKPDTFSFTAQTKVALSTVVESNMVTVNGINARSA